MNVMKKTLAARIRRIAHRTYGKNHGFATRLMSPSDFGEILKPFVFLDLFHHEGEPFSAPLHPHSGIATLTYVVEGAVSYIARGITDGRYENLFVGRTVLPGLLEEVKAIFKEALIPTLQE